MKNQIERILKKNFNITLNFKNTPTDTICDLTDGEIYGDFKKKETIGYNFTSTLFTDGISICEKSNLIVLPFAFAINEQTIKGRYCIENNSLIIYFNYL
jgi:hypothetical protein